jgi:hypothetical protein
MEKQIHNDINVILDERVKGFIESGSNVIVDFRETMYGSGFIVDSGSHC